MSIHQASSETIKRMMGATSDGLCLICHSQTPSAVDTCHLNYFHPLNPPLLSKDLATYFLLRRIFKLSREELQNYLKHCPCPGEWVRVCSSCTDNYIEKCTKIFVELLDVKRRFRAARNEIIEAVKTSVENEPEFLPDSFTLDISGEIRQFVAQSEKELEPDHSIGDLRATDWILHHSKIWKDNSSPLEKMEEDVTNDEIKVELPEEQITNQGDDVDNMEDHFEKASSNESEKDNSGDDDWSEGLFESEDGSTDDDDDDEEHSPSSPVEEIVAAVPPAAKYKGTSKRKAATPRKARPPKKPKVKPTEFFCDECPKVCPTRKSLHYHKKGCHGSFRFCSVEGCEYKSRRQEEVTNHWRRHHGTAAHLERLTCPTCNKIFSKTSHLYNHMNTKHRETPAFKCDQQQCEKTFNDKINFLNHLAQVHQVKEYQRYPCEHEGCDLKFYQKCLLRLHEKTHETKIRIRKEKKLTGFPCDLCSKTFKTERSLQRHVDKHEVPGEKAPSERFFQCDQCPKTFTDSKKFGIHKTTHRITKRSRETTPIQCSDSECDFKTRIPSVLKIHKRRYHHGSEADFEGLTCPTCHKRVTSLFNLVSHVSRRHARTEGALRCDFCEETPEDETSLRTHLAEVHHLNEFQEHSCILARCGQTFYTECLLELHRQGHYKVLHCHICDKKCGSLKLWSFHLKRHGRLKTTIATFPCNLCSVAFTSMDGLECHRKLKHGMAPDNVPQPPVSLSTAPGVTLDGKITFPCPQEGCSTRVSCYNEYQVHRQVHYDPKSLPSKTCPECGKVFKFYYKLQSHMLKVHHQASSHICELCGKDLVNPVELRCHKVHAHFICATKDCNFQGADLADVWKHQKELHGKEVGAWACDQCGKLFKFKSKVAVHKQIHAVEERQRGGDQGGGEWVCDLCGKQFALKQYLYYHNWHTHQKLRKNKSRRTGEKKAVWVTPGWNIVGGNLGSDLPKKTLL